MRVLPSVPTMPIDVRTATEDDREMLHDLLQETFAAQRRSFSPAQNPTKVPIERKLVATDGGRIVGQLGTWEFGQWFGGRRIAMGGITNVAIAPSHRRRGVGSGLLRVAIDAMRARRSSLDALSDEPRVLPAAWLGRGRDVSHPRVHHSGLGRSSGHRC